MGENGQWVLIVETHLLLIEIDEVLCLNVCDEHGDADLRRGFVDVVGGPDGIVVLCEAEEIFLSRLIGYIHMDICRFGQPFVCLERVVCGDREILVFKGEVEANEFSGCLFCCIDTHPYHAF